MPKAMDTKPEGKENCSMSVLVSVGSHQSKLVTVLCQVELSRCPYTTIECWSSPPRVHYVSPAAVHAIIRQPADVTGIRNHTLV